MARAESAGFSSGPGPDAAVPNGPKGPGLIVRWAPDAEHKGFSSLTRVEDTHFRFIGIRPNFGCYRFMRGTDIEVRKSDALIVRLRHCETRVSND